MTTLYAINLRTFGISRYTGLDPVAVVEHDGTTYVASATALKTFAGTQDGTTPITATVKTGDLQLGQPTMKQVPRAYLNLGYAGRASLKVDTVDVGRTTSVTYPVEKLSDATGTDTVRRIELARGPKGAWWNFQVQNVHGAGIQINGLEILSVPLNRRI